MLPASAPAPMVVAATAIVVASATAFTVQAGEGVGTHGADADTDAESAKDVASDHFGDGDGHRFAAPSVKSVVIPTSLYFFSFCSILLIHRKSRVPLTSLTRQ